MMNNSMPEMLNRKIIISEVISDSLAGQVIDQIITINDFDAQMSVVSTYQPEPIEMFINSVGGSASAGFAIISAMEMSETPIITYGLGIVASMALAIFVAGDYRAVSRLARLMYHSVAYEEGGYIKDHEDALEESRVIQEMYNSILLDRTKMPKELMRKICDAKSNFFISGKKAVKLGFADEVLARPEKKIQSVTEEEFEKIMKDAENKTNK